MNELADEFQILILNHRDWSSEYGYRCCCGWSDNGGWEEWSEHFSKVLAQFVVRSTAR